jgi:oxygen-independent coproporphyrinogen-3 oxidase
VIDSGLVMNIDLMYGLPGQTHASFHRDFATLAELGVPSMTVYDLRLNERTPVARTLKEGERLELEQLLEWRSFVVNTASEFGFSQTRWHTFKRMDTPAAHHQRAPHHDPAGRGYQLGIGLSARSQLGSVVYRNHTDMGTYLERVETGVSPVEQIIELQDDDRRTQYVMTTLGDGLSLDRADYEATFGEPFAVAFGEPARRLLAGGLLEEEGQVLRLSPIGRLLYDRVAYNFYPARVLEWMNSRRPMTSAAVSPAPGGA